MYILIYISMFHRAFIFIAAGYIQLAQLQVYKPVFAVEFLQLSCLRLHNVYHTISVSA